MRSAMAAALLLGGLATAGLAQDAGTFRLYQGTMEIGRETFRDDGATLRFSVVIPLASIQLTGEVSRDSGRARRAVMRAFAPGTDSLLRTYTATVVGDSVRVAMSRTGRADTEWARAAAPDEITAEQSIAGIVSLVQRAGRAPHDYAVWFPASNATVPLHVAFRGDSADVTIGPQRLLALLGPDGKVRQVEQGTAIRFVRFTGDSLPPLAGLRRPTPDYSAPAGAPYTAENVRVPVRPAAGDTFSLGCTLTKPATGGPRFPAAITLTGSGLEDRDENLWPLVPGYHPFRQLAERLAREGIAVLRCDDRSFGASTGSADTATMLSFAADGAAQLAWLRGRADIDGARLAVVGHSEGGTTGPMIAAEDPRLKAVVIMAGIAKPFDQVVLDQTLYPVESDTSLHGAARDSARAEARRQADAFMSRQIPYLVQARQLDPLAIARRVRQPVLIVQGALDRQVSAGQADTLGAAIHAAGNRDVTVRVFPGLNHLFLVSPSGTGAGSEYATLTDVQVPEAVLDTIADWLVARLQPRRERRARPERD